MAKRMIERVEDQDGLTSETEPPETPVVNKKEAPPAEKPVRPEERKEIKPLDLSISVKAPGVFVMRVWNGMVLFPDKRRMAKIPIVPGKPVQIRITQ